MKMARATEGDVKALRDFLLELEEANDDDKDPEEIAAIVRRFPNGWRRVVEGYRVLVDNVCDPSLNYLEFKPEIRLEAPLWTEEELIG